jgi:hypothetical protein
MIANGAQSLRVGKRGATKEGDRIYGILRIGIPGIMSILLILSVFFMERLVMVATILL